jgi:phosphoribosyl 1,2-cyclic phosphate phosphodiesterase
MKLLFLGTGASLGVPVLGCNCSVCRSEDSRDKRMRTSVFIQSGDENILIDPGPDFRQQCLRHGITRIDSFLITHSHHDHIGGLDDTRPVYYAMDRKPLRFFAEEFTIEGIRKHFDYLFPADGNPHYHGAPKSEFISIRADELFETGQNTIRALRGWHGEMPVTGFKIGNLVYLTDVKTVPATTRSHIDGQTVLVLGALHKQAHPLHFNLAEALEFVRQTGPLKTYLVHASHYMGKYKDVSRILPENVYLAYDGLEILIPPGTNIASGR